MSRLSSLQMDHQKKNMSGNKEDVFSRYKRDRIVIVKQKKNGIQTKMKNLNVIAKQIHAQADHICIFLQKSLNASIKDQIIRMDVSESVLDAWIDKYITKFCQCKKCHLPEINTNTKTCDACGEDNTIQMDKKKKQKKKEEKHQKENRNDGPYEVEDKELTQQSATLMEHVYKLISTFKECKSSVEKLNVILDTLWKVKTKEELKVIQTRVDQDWKN